MRANLMFPRTAILVSLMWRLAAANQPGPGDSNTGATRPGDVGLPPAAYAASQLVVKPRASATPAEFLESDAVLGVVHSLSHSPTFLIQMVPGARLDSAIDALEASGQVAYAHPNYTFNSLHPVQGSYPFPDVNGVGDFALQPATLSLSLVAAHGMATGVGTRVGVIDGGVDPTHPLLVSAVEYGHDFVDEDEISWDEPGGTCSGHGTFVAGMVHLVAPDAELSAYRVADRNGSGDGFTLARAIERAVDDGCDIINISLVLMKRHLAVRDAILYAESHGVLVVAAAGNSANATPLFPAAELGAMAVGGLDGTDQKAPFSSYGSHLSVCAPGVELYSCYQQGYAWWSGTSFSAPLVAGAAALVAELLPGASGDMLRGVLELTAVPLDLQNPTLPGQLGFGRIDPVAALHYTDSAEWATVTPDTLYFTHQIGRLYLLAPFQYAQITSTNAPAAYFAEVIGPDSAFAWVSDSVGTTPDSVRVEIAPPEVPGTFVNTVVFHVQGVAEPSRLVVHLEVEPADSGYVQAWVSPPALYFQALPGDTATLSRNVVISSQPAGLAYTALVFPPDHLTSLSHTSGTTHDSVTILVNPSHSFSQGLYEDTVVFQVEGVPYPVPLLVMINITDSLPPPGDSAWVVPSTLYFNTVEGFVPTVMLSQSVQVFAPGAPRPFVAGVYGPDPAFAVFLDSTGMTYDSIEVLVNPVGWTAGTYHNTLQFYVNGISQPALVHVYLNVQPDSIGTLDTAAVVPSLLSVQAPAGSTLPIERSVLLYSTNPGALYFAYAGSWPSFLSLPDSVGHTPDTVRIVVDPSGLAAGLHEDTVWFEVAGTSFPARLAVRLTLTSGDTISPVSPRNYPNPFNPETQISFSVPASGRVHLVVYNLLGECVTTLVDRELPAGEHRFIWNGTTHDGRQAPSGVYFYRLSVAREVYTGKMMMLR